MPKLVLPVVLSLTLAVLAAGVAGAQPGGTPPQAAGPQQGSSPSMYLLRQRLAQIHTPQSMDEELDRLTKDLSLTPEQRAQVRPILEQHHQQIQALLDANKDMTVEQFHARTHEISDETHAKIGALLTSAQQDAVKAMLVRMRSGQECRRDCGSPPASF